MSGNGDAGAVAATPPLGPYDLAVHPEIEHLSDAELRTLRASLQQVIPIRENGIAYAEARRGQFASIAGAMLSLGIATFPLSNLLAWTPGRLALIALGICFVLGGLATWVVYAFQVNYPYPFVQVGGQSWKWFYHQALPAPAKFGPTLSQLITFRLRAPSRDAAQQATKKKEYFKQEQDEVERQFGQFGEQVRGLSQDKIDATQDLRQLYRLHLNERYKNLFLTQLRTVLTAGIAISVVLPLIVLSVASLVARSNSVEHSQTTSQDIETSSTWIPTGRVRQNGIASVDVEYRLMVDIRNRATSAAGVVSLTATDSKRRPIPAEFNMQPAAASVAGLATIHLIGYMWLPAEDATHVAVVKES